MRKETDKPPEEWSSEPPPRRGFFDTSQGKFLLGTVALGTLGTAVGSTATAAQSARATRVQANATEAANARNGTVQPGGRLVVKRGLATPIKLRVPQSHAR